MNFRTRNIIGALSLGSLLFMGGCETGSSDLDNLRPDVDAGIDQSVSAGAAVTLDGGKSIDSDGSIVHFSWVQVSGPRVKLSNADTELAKFTAPPITAEALLTFRLSATDNDGATSSDEVSITVRPIVATAASGIDVRPSNTSCVAPERPAASAGDSEIELQPAFSPLEFEQPLALLQAPGDNTRWYVVERGGYVRTFTGEQTSATIFANLADRVSSIGAEQGLLGMAFHPDFTSNGYVFLSYTKSDGASVISRFGTTGGLTLDPDSEQVLLTVAQPNANHNGGGIAFGPDGFLYIGIGDGGGAGDEENNAQNPHNLLGAMLRIDVDNSGDGKPYVIPIDNPFAASSGCGNREGCPEIWAWGLRNPWKWSFDSATGKLWAGDVGQDNREEVNIIELGKNYGWRCYEGLHEYNLSNCGAIEEYTFPVVEYNHGSSGGSSITGGYVYRGTGIPGLQGTYLYGDFVSGRIWGVSVQQGSRPRELLSTNLRIASFAQGNDGELYVLDYSGGKIHKIVEREGSFTDGKFPRKLSQTGCFSADEPTEPLPALIPYGVNSPLWSDGAVKHRWFAVPDGKTIQIDTDGNNWIFPPGSVLVKEFRLDKRRVETRLLIRHDDGGWAGYSYEWNEQQTDATLLAGAKSKSIDGQVWEYPSRAQCMACHTEAAGFVLGAETAQLNGLFTYPQSTLVANQIDTLAHINLFTNPLPDKPENLDALVNYKDPSVPIDARARAYLYANCSSCHRPGAVELADFRYDTPLNEMGVCDAPPLFGRMGVGSNARLLAPGLPSHSVILARMGTTGAGRMPPLGTRVVDSVGLKVIDDWIGSLTDCQQVR